MTKQTAAYDFKKVLRKAAAAVLGVSLFFSSASLRFLPILQEAPYR